MAIGRLTNFGRRWLASVGFTGAKPGATTDGDVGLTNNGSSIPSFWVVLLNTNFGFTSHSNGPNPDLATVAAITSAYPNSVITPSGNYQDNDVPRNRTRMVTTLDDSTDKATLAFIAGQEPLLTVTNAGGITNVAGWALCTGNGVSTDYVIAIFPFASTLASVPVNNRIKINDTAVDLTTS